MLSFPAAHGVEERPPGHVLQNPRASIGTILDFAEHLAHLSVGSLGDDTWAAGIIAVLGRIADRVRNPLSHFGIFILLWDNVAAVSIDQLSLY